MTLREHLLYVLACLLMLVVTFVIFNAIGSLVAAQVAA
jgi:hypothetical protein